MPRSAEGVWVEITRTPNPQDAAFVRPLASRDAALTAANETGNRAIMIRYGESLEEALDRESRAGSTVGPRSSGVGAAAPRTTPAASS